MKYLGVIDMDKLKTYVVACNAEPTCIITAQNKKQAEQMAKEQADVDLGDCDTNWKAEEINEYFSDVFKPDFFGWVKSPGQSYMTFK